MTLNDPLLKGDLWTWRSLTWPLVILKWEILVAGKKLHVNDCKSIYVYLDGIVPLFEPRLNVAAAYSASDKRKIQHRSSLEAIYVPLL